MVVAEPGAVLLCYAVRVRVLHAFAACVCVSQKSCTELMTKLRIRRRRHARSNATTAGLTSTQVEVTAKPMDSGGISSTELMCKLLATETTIIYVRVNV